MNKLKKIEDLIRQEKEYLKEKFYVTKIGVFGS